jgi:hypothetical protein
MAFSNDWNLQEIVPDILDFGIENFIEDHAEAQKELTRTIRNRWWNLFGSPLPMDEDELVDSQWTKANSYLVLWKYALPKLTNWIETDRFLEMIDFYKALYEEELDAIFLDGVDYNGDVPSSGGGGAQTGQDRLVR